MLLQSHLKNISLYRNLQIRVNILYVPGTFLPFSLEEQAKSHPRQPLQSNFNTKDVNISLIKKEVHLIYWVSRERTSQN